MKRVMKRQQAGVVLVFSLLILLLVTLLGVNMVQQNRVQFLMAANAQQQSTTFSDAEDVLRLAEAYIDQTRYEVWPLTTYTLANFPTPFVTKIGNTLYTLPDVFTYSATNLPSIQDIIDDIAGLANKPIGGVITSTAVNYPDPKYACKKTGTPARFDQLKALPAAPLDITNKLSLSVAMQPVTTVQITATSCLRTPKQGGKEVPCSFDGVGYCNAVAKSEFPIACPTEIYTLQVTVIDASGSKREIEAKYGVRCDL